MDTGGLPVGPVTGESVGGDPVGGDPVGPVPTKKYIRYHIFVSWWCKKTQ